MKKNSDNPVVKRILKALGLKKLIDIARLCKITQQNLNGYIDRGTLTELVENELSERNINIDWIKTGQGDMLNKPANDEPAKIISEVLAPYLTPATSSSDNSHDIQNAVRYAVIAFEILTSKTGYANALRENITWFREAVEDRKRSIQLKEDFELMKKKLSESGIL